MVILQVGDMELALESYDVCTGMLQNQAKPTDRKEYTIYLPNLKGDAAISVEEIDCQSLEEIQRLYETGDFESVVRLLQATLNYGGSAGSNLWSLSAQSLRGLPSCCCYRTLC